MSDRRRSRLPARDTSHAWKLSRERIIPVPHVAQTSRWDATAVTVRGSLLIVVLCVPMLMIPGFVTSGVLPFLALFLTASHGSLLVRQWIRRR